MEVGNLINFVVDQETCIGCRACAEAFPDQFQMNDDINKAYTTGIPAGEHDPKEAVLSCPVDSISIVDFLGRLLMNPQETRDGKELPDDKLQAAVKDYDAMPPEKRPVIEVKSSGKAKAAPAEPGTIPDGWFLQFRRAASDGDEGLALPKFAPWIKRWLWLLRPVWGGMSDRFKSRLVELGGEDTAISPGAATTLNALTNFVLYPAVVWFAVSGKLGIVRLEGNPLLGTVLVFGVGYAFVEFAFRLKDEIFDWGITERDRVYPAAFYLAPVSNWALNWLEHLCTKADTRAAIYDPATMPRSEDPEVERLYGRAISAAPLPEGGGVHLDVEFPSKLRLSSGEEIALPEYTHDIAASENRIVVKAWVDDPSVSSLWSYRNPFPLSWERAIELPGTVDSVEQERKGRKLRVTVRLRKD